jgi:hypothetical protein
MKDKLVRFTVWVEPKQKAQVEKWAKLLSKKEKRTVSASEIIRLAIKDKS